MQKFLKKINTRERFITTAIGWPAEITDPLSYIVMACMNLCGIILCYFDPPITWGGCLCTTTENHKIVHGFNEELKMAEDLDYGKRSGASGARYHVYLYLYLLHSYRRLKKMGRISLFFFYCHAYFIIKKYGFEALQHLRYTFGDYTKTD